MPLQWVYQRSNQNFSIKVCLQQQFIMKIVIMGRMTIQESNGYNIEEL